MAATKAPFYGGDGAIKAPSHGGDGGNKGSFPRRQWLLSKAANGLT
jgi:hypothetical protein